MRTKKLMLVTMIAAGGLSACGNSSVKNDADSLDNHLRNLERQRQEARLQPTQAADAQAEQASDHAAAAYDEASKAVGDATDAAANKAEGAVDSAKERGAEAIDDAANAANNVQARAQDTYNQASEKASDVAANAQDRAQDAYNQASDKASDAANATRDAAVNAKDTVVAGANNVGDRLNETTDAARARGEEVASAAQDKAAAALDASKNAAVDAKNTVVDAGQQTLDASRDAAAAAQAKANEAAEAVKANAQAAANKTRGFFNRVGHATYDTAKVTVGGVVLAGEKVVSGVVVGAKTVVNGTAHAARRVGNGVVASVNAIGSGAKQAGQVALGTTVMAKDGLVNGAAWVRDRSMDVANGVIGSVSNGVRWSASKVRSGAARVERTAGEAQERASESTPSADETEATDPYANDVDVLADRAQQAAMDADYIERNLEQEAIDTNDTGRLAQSASKLVVRANPTPMAAVEREMVKDAARTERELGLDLLADAVCSSYADENDIGEGCEYESFKGCIDTQVARFGAMYTTDKCGDAFSFDTQALDGCIQMAAAKEVSYNPVTHINFQSLCSAEQICR